jgi:hypothetical protein
MIRWLASCLFLSACASSIGEKPGPRGLSADQHLAIANREDERASQVAHWPERQGRLEGDNPADPLLAGTWFGTWDTVPEHERAASVHRAAAAELDAEYEQACGGLPSEVAAVSPLQRYGVGVTATDGGVLVLLSPEAGPPDRLLSAMRCHRAWMMLGRTLMDDCPLDLPGLQVSARGDANGIELTITVADPGLVGELQRRAAHDLEVATSRRSARAIEPQ